MKLKIILINPVTLFSTEFDWNNVPLISLVSLGSYLKHHEFKDNKDVDVQIINMVDEKIYRPKDLNDLNTHIQDLKSFLNKFTDSDNIIWGISIFTPNYYISAIVLSSVIRSLFPNQIICAGGYHVNYFPDDFIFPDNFKHGLSIKKKIFDYLFLGESEIELGNLLKLKYDTKTLYSDPLKPTQIIDCAPVQNLEILPMPDYSLMKFQKEPILTIPVEFSRGCPHNCNFCGDYRSRNPKYKNFRWRMISPDRAIQILNTVSNYFHSINQELKFAFFDPLFWYPKKRIQLYESLISKNFQDEIWFEVRIDNFDEKTEPKYFKKLNISVDFGLESGSEKMLTIMNKTKHPKDYLAKLPHILGELNKNDAYSVLNMIFGHPGETKETLSESLLYIEGLSQKFHNLIPSFSKFMITLGSDVYLNSEKYEKLYGMKIFYPKYWLYLKDISVLSQMVIPSKDLSIDDLFGYAVPRIKTTLEMAIKKLGLINNRNIIYQKWKYLGLDQLIKYKQINLSKFNEYQNPKSYEYDLSILGKILGDIN